MSPLNAFFVFCESIIIGHEETVCLYSCFSFSFNKRGHRGMVFAAGAPESLIGYDNAVGSRLRTQAQAVLFANYICETSEDG